MLVCNVSLRPPRSAIAATIVETATAVDAAAFGNIVFATLIDDPASVGDLVDAYLGEIMLEAASASDAADAGLAYAAVVNEAVTSADAPDATTTAAPAATTWNPSDRQTITLSGGNLTATATATNSGVRSVSGKSSGKYYWEATVTAWANNSTAVGVGLSTASFTGFSAGWIVCNRIGNITRDGSNTGSSLGIRSPGDTIGIAVDVGATLIWFRVAPSGNWNGSGTADPATGTGGISFSSLAGTEFAAFLGGQSSEAGTANFGGSAFSGSVPAGFTSGWS